MPSPQNTEVEEFDVDDESKGVENLDQEVDETPEDESEEVEDEESDDDGGAEDEDQEEGKSEAAEFDKRYTQLKGDSPEDYAKSLEEAYANSSAEGVKLNRELASLKEKTAGILAAAEKDPDLAKRIGITDEDAEAVNPQPKSTSEAYAQQLMEERMDTEYKEFAERHTEIDTDDSIRKELLDEVSVQSAAYKAKTGRIISMKDALERSWKILGYDETNPQEKLAVKAKETASTSTAQSKPKSKKSAPTPISDKAIEMAKRFGLSEKDVQKYYKP